MTGQPSGGTRPRQAPARPHDDGRQPSSPPATLTLASAVFMVAALGMGIFISTLARSQFVAAQTAIMATMLPTIILSGFIFDIDAMPGWVQAVIGAVTGGLAVYLFQRRLA